MIASQNKAMKYAFCKEKEAVMTAVLESVCSFRLQDFRSLKVTCAASTLVYIFVPEIPTNIPSDHNCLLEALGYLLSNLNL